MAGMFILSGAVAILALLLFSSVKAPSSNNAAEKINTLSFPMFSQVVRMKSLWNCAGIAIMEQIVAYGTAISFATEYASSIGASSFELAVISTSFIVGGLAGTTVLSNFSSAKMSDRTVCIFSFLMMAAGSIIIPFIKVVWAICICQALVGCGRSVSMSVLMAHAVGGISPSVKSTALSLFQSLYSIGTAAGPVIMGILLERFITYKAPYAVFAIIAVIGCSHRL